MYGNKATVRIQQCANCYQDDHILNSDRCTGLREWQDYCKEFEEKKRAASLIQTRKENEHDGEENAGITNDEGMSRLGELEDAKRENESLKNKLNEAEARAAIHLEEQEKKMEEVVANMNEKAKEMKDQLEKMKKQEEASEEKIKDERTKSDMILKEKESEIIKIQLEKKNVDDELDKLKEECKKLEEEKLALREKERELQRNENILSNSLERSNEISNLMDCVSNFNKIIPTIVVDDPSLGHEELKSDWDTSEDDDKMLINEGDDTFLDARTGDELKLEEDPKKSKRARNSPENNEPLKKAHLSEDD